MIRSMFTAISSLQLNQYFMDVVGNNLANANTIGYKTNRFSIQDQFSQVMSVGSAPTDSIGGKNPIQVGLGSRMGTITPIFTQGSLRPTGRNTDLAIEGDGFFIYRSGEETLYSRDGMLDMDADGYLIHAATGARIQGWQAAGSTLNTGQATSALCLPLGSTLARATENVTLTGNLDAATALNTPYDVTVGVYDSLGVLQSLTLSFTRTADNTWSWASADDPTQTGALTFDSAGQYAAGTGSVTLPGTGGAAGATINIDFSKLSQLANTSDVTVMNQDGLAAGDLTGFYISEENAQVYGLYSNGMQQLVGQLALARFINPAGLLRVGENMYQMGINSGDASVGAVNTGGRGSIVSGTLEGSNVDMAQEFTNMILAQRGFQASSRVITASDEMLQELVNIKR